MDMELFTRNWALIVAALPALIAVILILRLLLGRTARGQLRKMLRGHRAAQRELADTRRAREKAQTRLERLTSIAAKTKPRTLQEAREAVEDAQSLEKIAEDKLQISANHVRRVIHEDFPPDRQAKLREKYLPQDNEDDRPYTFR